MQDGLEKHAIMTSFFHKELNENTQISPPFMVKISKMLFSE